MMNERMGHKHTCPSISLYKVRSGWISATFLKHLLYCWFVVNSLLPLVVHRTSYISHYIISLFKNVGTKTVLNYLRAAGLEVFFKIYLYLLYSPYIYSSFLWFPFDVFVFSHSLFLWQVLVPSCRMEVMSHLPLKIKWIQTDSQKDSTYESSLPYRLGHQSCAPLKGATPLLIPVTALQWSTPCNSM